MRLRWLAGGLLAITLLGGCYRAARPFAASRFDREPGWLAVPSVPIMRQQGVRDCGAAVTAMLLHHWKLDATQADVRAASGLPSDRGLRADFIREYLRDRGLRSFLFEGTLTDLQRELEQSRPVMVGVLKAVSRREMLSHYLLVVGLNLARKEVVVIDPADGLSVYSFTSFVREWKAARFLTMAVFALPATVSSN